MTPRHAAPFQKLLLDDEFEGDIHSNEPMARHTTYHIGGPARYFVTADTLGALRHSVQAAAEEGLQWCVVGRGSNLLVSDEGYDGVIARLGRDFRNFRVDGEAGCICAGAGIALSAVVQEAFRRSLAGLEFAVGTPGTIGGALRMNAGTRDEWIGSAVRSITVLDEGTLKRIDGAELQWDYRRVSLPSQAIILECELAVSQADPFYIRGKMEAALSRRKRTQPLSAPSCGSVFKNPDGQSVGALVEELGLKGTQIGGAQISSVHGNFIVNEGGATAHDVAQLMALIREEVEKAYGIELTPEVRFLGFE